MSADTTGEKQVQHIRARRGTMKSHPHLVLFACLLVIMAKPGRAANDAEASFLAENQAAMSKMMSAMEIKPSGDVDADFVAMMIPHHQAAIGMAQAVLRDGHNEQIRRIAQEMIAKQQQEIAEMRAAVGK
jgi:uncharacterized protein (DUF305 family)